MAAYGAAIAAVYMALLVCSCCLQWGNAQTDCVAALAGLSGCFAFLTDPSTTPDKKTCCDPLESVLATPASFQCICAQATNSKTPTVKNALLLPKSCKLAINVSEANCTTTAKSPATSTTPSTPASSTATPAGNSSAGVMAASPTAAIFALAGLWSIVSFFA